MGAPKTFEKCSAGSSLAPPSAPGLIRNNRTKSIRPFQVDYGEVHPAVLEGCQDLLHPALLPPSLPSKLVEIQKIDVVKIEKVKVEVILSAGAKRRGLEKVIARLLRGLALSHGFNVTGYFWPIFVDQHQNLECFCLMNERIRS